MSLKHYFQNYTSTDVTYWVTRQIYFNGRLMFRWQRWNIKSILDSKQGKSKQILGKVRIVHYCNGEYIAINCS